MNITKLSVGRPTLVVVFFTVLVFLGLSSYSRLNYELVPQFVSPIISVVTIYPGASPSEVESSVSKKLEDALSTLQNVQTIRSISQEGISMLLIEVSMSANIDYALQDAQRKINAVRRSLPEDILEPTVSGFSLNDLPIMNIGATSNLDPAAFHDLLKYRIQPELERIAGVGSVSLVGGREREIRVSLYADRLETRGLSPIQIVQAIQSSNLDFPTGQVRNDQTQMVIRLSAKFRTVADIENVVVAIDPGGSPVKLRDVAEVRDTEKDQVTLSRINGRSAVGMSILKQADANTVEVSHRIESALASLAKNHEREGLHFEIPSNTAAFTEEAANSVLKDLGYAVVLVALMMLLFLHSFRDALIVMTAVPLSIIISFTAMYVLGYSLNMMTLLAVSLSIGILVDDAIVVLENIHRHLETGKDRVTATLEGRSEIAITAVSITLVDVVVFLPVALSKSLVSFILTPYAAVIVVSTLLSMLVAFTAVPLLTSRFAKLSRPVIDSPAGRFANYFERSIDGFATLLQRALRWAFGHKAVTLLSAAALLVGALVLVPTGFVGSEFMGMGDAAEFIIQLELPKDATLKETNQKALEAERLLYTKPEVKTVFTTVGAAGNAMFSANGAANKAEIDVKLVDKEQRTMSSLVLANTVKNELAGAIVGVKVTTAVVDPMVGGADVSPLWVVVKSVDREALSKYGTVIQHLMESTPGAKDVTSSLEEKGSEISVEIDKEKMADLGVSLGTVGAVMRTAFSGNTDAKLTSGPFEYDINVVLDELDRRSLADVASIAVPSATGQLVKLSQFAHLSYGTGWTKLERYDRVPSVSIEGQVLGRSSGDVADEIKAKIEALSLPPGVSVAYEGDMKYRADAMGSLGFALLTSIFLVYMIMVALYESYLYPLVVLFSIPLATVGAILALALTNTNLSIFSMLGMIMLVGLVSKNAILVVDFTNHLKRAGHPTAEALLGATRLRLRPVLMTTASMVVGLLPLALASGAAAEWKNGIAWVLIGGLTSSMFLTLIIVPVVYLIADRAKERLGRLLSVAAGPERTPPGRADGAGAPVEKLTALAAMESQPARVDASALPTPRMPE